MIKPDGTREFVQESKHTNIDLFPYEKREAIKAELNKLNYPPELKAVIGSANRGRYEVKRGEYHHQIKDRRFITQWRKVYALSDYSDEESSLFARALINRDKEGISIFSIRNRLRVVRKRRKRLGQPFGKFARSPRDRRHSIPHREETSVVNASSG